VEELGTEAACQIARMELANIRAVHEFARENNIACESRLCQTIDVIYDQELWDNGRQAVAAMERAMPEDDASKYEFHTRDAVRDRFYCGDGIPGDDVTGTVYGGIEYFAGSLSAYRFTIGVLKLCLARGLNLQTNTPATSLIKLVDSCDGYKWGVNTPSGTIMARRVVVATNGYTASLLKQFQGIIVPLRGQISAHRSGSEMPWEGLSTTYTFAYKDGYEYMIPYRHGFREGIDGNPPVPAATSDTIIMGGGLTRAAEGGLGEYGTTDDSTINPTISKYLRETTPRYFGKSWGTDNQLGRVKLEWTGIMGYSPDGMPFVGEMPDETASKESDLWICASFQGHGMVYCWMCARALVEMMKGRDDSKLCSWFPDAFRLKKERFSFKFDGRLHVSSNTSHE
jgi:glycine/D-amino acid oxidase-like deaminating enzyme